MTTVPLFRSRFMRPLALATLLPVAATLGLAQEAAPAKAPKTTPKAAAAAKKSPTRAESPLADWVEPEFPFFSSILDARKAGAKLADNNLTPRGLILNLGGDLWACFDVDLLRISAIWKGKGVTPTALAPGSYHDVTRKTQGGQKNLPEPDGALWIANGIYPGWQTGDTLSLTDPREPAPSPEEIGRGPIAETLGRFDAIRQVEGGILLEYTIAGTKVREAISRLIPVGGHGPADSGVLRTFEIAAGDKPLLLALGKPADGTVIESRHDLPKLAPASTGVATVSVPARTAPIMFAVMQTPKALGTVPTTAKTLGTTAPKTTRWPQTISTTVKLSTAKDAYVVDHIPLPANNPWKRGVRPADVQFMQDGRAFMTTLDGDVWLARGLDVANTAGTITWKRYASGLHEPMTCAIRDEELFVFDKNGIWRLRDTDGNDEADVHELFSNAFAQTADNREFPSQIRLAPNGEFIIAKGGQQDTTLGKHNGSVLRVSADGKKATLLGHGFRQPNIGVNIRTGLVTSSDQQGQYIPSTPLHIVRDNQFYGFLAAFLPKDQYPEPIADPLTWIPHAVDSSALSQVWLFGARMGPLTDQLVHIGFNKPEVFRVIINERGSRPQASVVSITRAFEYPPLNGSVNPIDGQLYIAGFQVLGWGNIIDVGAGFGRVRYTGAPVTLPREIVPMDKGVLIRFESELDAKKAMDPGSYSLQSWSYKRSYKYGSAQYKDDGQPGQDSLVPSGAYLAKDGRSVFIAVPGMKPVMQLRVGWALATKDGKAFEENAYTTPYELAKFDPEAEGFGKIAIDLTPRAVVAQEVKGPVSLEEGQRVAQLFACVACHSHDTAGLVKAGPSWKGLYGKPHPVFVAGKKTEVTANEAYLRESILEPTAKIAVGFEKGEYAMPSYAGVLSQSQIDSLVLYIKSLK